MCILFNINLGLHSSYTVPYWIILAIKKLSIILINFTVPSTSFSPVFSYALAIDSLNTLTKVPYYRMHYSENYTKLESKVNAHLRKTSEMHMFILDFKH